MPRKRLIFTLLNEGGIFMLSRNFRLQNVGDIEWLLKHYNFKDIAFSIDELVILNVNRQEKEWDLFSETLKKIVNTCFIPIAAGGGIRSEAHAELLIKSGADKLVLNTTIYTNVNLVKSLVKTYGSQCIICSIDYKVINGEIVVFIENGSKPLKIDFQSYLKHVDSLKVGEIYLNSIDQDGTGQGYLLDVVDKASEELTTPLILAGGAGNYEHFIEGLSKTMVDAVATANLFNFIGNGFPDARDKIIEMGIDLAIWNRNSESELENYFNK